MNDTPLATLFEKIILSTRAFLYNLSFFVFRAGFKYALAADHLEPFQIVLSAGPKPSCWNPL